MRSALRQGKHTQRFVVSSPIRGSHDGDVLLAILSLIGHRNGGHVVIQLKRPEFLARLRIEGAKPFVASGADKNKPTSRDHRSTVARGANVLLTFRHVVVDSERNAPHEF